MVKCRSTSTNMRALYASILEIPWLYCFVFTESECGDMYKSERDRKATEFESI